MLATSFEWLRAPTSARVDMTLTAFLTGAFIALDRALSAAKPSPWALVCFYACMGLAALAKGPVGIILPSLVALVYLGLRRDLGRVGQLAGSWYAPAIAFHDARPTGVKRQAAPSIRDDPPGERVAVD